MKFSCLVKGCTLFDEKACHGWRGQKLSQEYVGKNYETILSINAIFWMLKAKMKGRHNEIFRNCLTCIEAAKKDYLTKRNCLSMRVLYLYTSTSCCDPVEHDFSSYELISFFD